MPMLWDQPNEFWDSGLHWDIGIGPNPGDVSPYLKLVTSEHNQKPDFMAMLAQVFQPIADGKFIADGMVSMFDVDTALGLQLDIIGLWVGRSRVLTVPITGIFFTFDTGPGYDQGIFRGPFDPVNSIFSLPDEPYRTLLKATIAANHWDGTVTGAYAAYALVFGPGGYTMLIIDGQDMTMEVVLSGRVPDAITLALLVGGYLDLKPAGVRVSAYAVIGDPTRPIFAFDADPTSLILGGFDTSAFATIYPGA